MSKQCSSKFTHFQNLLNEVVQQTFMRDPVEVHTQLDEVAQFIVDIDKVACFNF